MTNYLLLYFKVHLEGLSKLAQAQVLLQVNKRLLIHCMWESQQLPDSNQLLNFVFYLLTLQGSQQKDASTATDDVGTSAGAKSQDHLKQSTVYL